MWHFCWGKAVMWLTMFVGEGHEERLTCYTHEISAPHEEGRTTYIVEHHRNRKTLLVHTTQPTRLHSMASSWYDYWWYVWLGIKQSGIITHVTYTMWSIDKGRISMNTHDTAVISLITPVTQGSSGIILVMGSVNERQRHVIMSNPIGWYHI